jgi:catechol 2,3-dioxygenase-like lactoylglutathione lyase family enzyme
VVKSAHKIFCRKPQRKRTKQVSQYERHWKDIDLPMPFVLEDDSFLKRCKLSNTLYYERLIVSTQNPNYPILELRIALTVSDYERSVKFYCEGLGIEPAAFWDNGQGKALMINMGNAALEIFDEAQAETIDQLEAGKRVSGQIRFALQVPDLKAAMERLLAHGATLVHPPVITPWGDYNVRLQAPDGMQITLFQVVDDKEQGE